MAVKNVAKEWSSARLEAGLQERGATRTLERFIGNSFSLYFVSRRFSRCSATAVHMYAGPDPWIQYRVRRTLPLTEYRTSLVGCVTF